MHHRAPVRRLSLSKLLAFIGAVGGGYAGWALGALIGTFTAFFVGIVGTAAGVYWGRRIGRQYEG